MLSGSDNTMRIRLTQRQINLGIFLLYSVAAWLLSLIFLLNDSAPVVKATVVGTALTISALSAAYWRGWTYSRYILVVAMALVVGMALPQEFIAARFTPAILIPPVLALVLTEPLWVLGVSVGMFVIVGLRTGGQSIYLDPAYLVMSIFVLGGMLLSRMATDNAQRLEEANQTAENARRRAEDQAQELARQAQELASRAEQQQQLLDLVTTLETPTINLAEGVLLAPVVGSLDTRRAQALTNRLLDAVNTTRAQLVVLDIAGVTLMDTGVAQALMRTVQAVRLLGCDVTLTGIAPTVALTLTQLGIQLTGVSTAASPQEALLKRAMLRQRAVSR
jgi:anti-anti-sigma regulatory factor